MQQPEGLFKALHPAPPSEMQLPLVVEPLVVEPLVVEPLVVEPLVAEPLVVEPLVAEPLVVEPLAQDESWVASREHCDGSGFLMSAHWSAADHEGQV